MGACEAKAADRRTSTHRIVWWAVRHAGGRLRKSDWRRFWAAAQCPIPPAKCLGFGSTWSKAGGHGELYPTMWLQRMGHDLFMNMKLVFCGKVAKSLGMGEKLSYFLTGHVSLVITLVWERTFPMMSGQRLCVGVFEGQRCWSGEPGAHRVGNRCMNALKPTFV